MDVDQTAGPSTNPLAYLEHEEAAAPATLKPYWTRIRTSYEKKLWHNMTVAIMDLVSQEESGPYQIDLFEKFIRTVESKLNALKLAEIARRVGREYTEPELTLEFLQSFHSRLPKPYPVPATAETPEVPAPPKPAPEAYALSLSSIAYAQLLLGDLPGCKKSLDECEKLLNEQDSVEPRVYAGYYGVAGDYYKVKAEYGPHYKSSLLYLACVDMDTEMDDAARRERARDLCIAALLGETIYNFGELLQHPVLASLKGTDKDWLRELISAFNAGEIGRFDSMTNHFSKEPILEASLPFLRQKICLMALIQAAFARPRDGSSKLMTFQSIAEATRLPVHEVEHLIMKALSLQLIRGTLDQVDSTADITWVQPRVLEGAQIDTLASQFNAWTESVGRTEKDVDHWRAHAKKVVHAM